MEADNFASLHGRIAVVTGAASGIGQATADHLAEHGVCVLVADVHDEEAQRTAETIRAKGGEAYATLLDVTSESSWKAVQDHIRKRWQRWDILINAAGVSFASPVETMSLENWRRVHAVNLDGAFLGMRTAWSLMKQSPEGGDIINVASLSGIIPFAGASAYAASKAALIQLSQVAALEGAQIETGIRVSAIAPGGVKTPMWRTMPFFQEWAKESEAAAWRQLDPDDRFLEPGEIAEAVLEVLLDPKTHPNGSLWILDQRGSRGRVLPLKESTDI